MDYKEQIVLFRTIVGSHMWGHHHSESDTDMFECYVVDTRSILLGNRYNKCKRTEGDNVETTSCEIGHVIEELLKGNINFLWGVMSPKFDFVTRNINPNVWDLRETVRENLSKNCVHSIRGFVIHNLKHWFGIELDAVHSVEQFNKGYVIVKKKLPKLIPEDKKYWKILNTCARTLDFGIKLLRDGILDFDNPRGAYSVGDIIILLGELEKAYNESPLPDKPDSEPFEKFLLTIRRREWIIDVIFRDIELNDMTIDNFCNLLKGIKDCREGNFVELR